MKRFSQEKSVNYDEIFSPVAKIGTRNFLSVAANDNMKLAQFDISTGFLYGNIYEGEKCLWNGWNVTMMGVTVFVS